jgi:ferredoxin
MEKIFSTTCVCADEDGRIVLEPYRSKLQPGQPFAVDQESNVLLAGGFAELSPDTTFPLSPTIQLQSDLVSSTENELLRLAEAELIRFQALSYHSYQVDADTRVCVVGAKASQLDVFIETYGGVLDIHPLLVNGASPDYPVVTDFQIEQSVQGLRILYRKRSPVNMEQCTYCGACGGVCPEKCITPHLYVNYEQCSFCKECERACVWGAVDISAVEEVIVAVPALILLSEVEGYIADDIENVYREKQLALFFKTLFSDEIKEVVCHNNSICQYSGRLDIGCARCVDSCPHQALSRQESGIAVDHLRCRDCGNCVSICPTGAMQNGCFGDETLLQYLDKIGAGEGKNLVIGGEQALHLLWWQSKRYKSKSTVFLEYSTVQALSLFHFLLFFSAGYRRVMVVKDDNGHALSTLNEAIDKANGIVAALFGLQNFIHLIEPAQYADNSAAVTVSHPLRSFLIPQTFTNRRAVFAEVLRHLLRQADKKLDVHAMGSDFLSISCNEDGCTQCLACLNECRTMALQADEKNLSLTYNAGLCVGCGVCVQVCPETVLSMAANSAIDVHFLQRKVIAQAEAVRCKRCGKVFGTRKSLDRVLEILSSREVVNAEHFEYCSTCRVVKLFETEEI